MTEHVCTHPSMLCGYGVDDSGWEPIVVPDPPLPESYFWKASLEYIGVRNGKWMVGRYRRRSARASEVFARGMAQADAEEMARLLNERDGTSA